MGKEEQGLDPQRYMVIPRTLILLFSGDQVLLLKGASNKKRWAGKYNGLGGHLERGEDAMAGACRELAEESGINTVKLALCGTILGDVEPHLGVMVFVYKGETENLAVTPNQEGELSWNPVGGLPSLDLVEDMRTIIPRVYKWQAGDAPFSALNSYDEKGILITKFHGD